MPTDKVQPESALGAAYEFGKAGSAEWLEGFVEECEELGLGKEAAASLLKTASQLVMCHDENFNTGFMEEFEKSAGMFSSLMNTPAWAAAPASILAYLGLQGISDAFRQNWGRNPEEAAMINQMGGAMNHPDPGGLIEQLDLMRRASHRARTPVGGNYSDPLLGGGGRGGFRNDDYYY